MSDKEAIRLLSLALVESDKVEEATEVSDIYKEMCRMAIKALEKQIPKKPSEIDEREGASFYYLAFMCPSCNTAVIGQPYRPSYCKHCGQRIDWDKEKE